MVATFNYTQPLREVFYRHFISSLQLPFEIIAITINMIANKEGFPSGSDGK